LSLIQEINQINSKIKFSIILDENPNAYINEKKILFITTGLLKYIPSYEALIGVLAHEVGHLENYHITKRIKSINNLRSINQLTTLSVIAASILANNSDFLVQSMITNQIGIQNYYSAFSKEQEREADIFAAQTLNQLHISSKPLKKFLTILEKESYQKGFTEEDYKFSSHPVYKERFDILENESIDQKYKFDQKYSDRFFFIKAKLFGFTENDGNELNKYLINDYYEYANSIILARKGKLKKSLIIINKLVNKYPKNIFLMETKADLLIPYGYTEEAMRFYQKVYDKDNNNHHIKKVIFEIEYEKIDKKYNNFSQEFFNDYSELLMIFPNSTMLHNKLRKIALLLGKDEWVSFIDANIIFNDISNEETLKKLNNILNTSQDKKLIDFIKKKIRLISNE
jgi:predicted Zn-dependent protease|tara:strand:+ start:216 stop:1412 length:1197 start_codon:yes stop_codon:yes gene_type:complete